MVLKNLFIRQIALNAEVDFLNDWFTCGAHWSFVSKVTAKGGKKRTMAKWEAQWSLFHWIIYKYPLGQSQKLV